MSNRDKAITIIVKTTLKCNMGCLYCYGGDQDSKKKISPSTVENMIVKVAEHCRSCGLRGTLFIWHGGEPLLMGLDFFKWVRDTQSSLDPEFAFKNVVQTNGLLLSDEFIDFFVKADFHVGLSLDGPPLIHDAQRLLSNGDASFDKVFRALERLRLAQVETRNGKASSLAVFTRNTLEHLEQFYEFFKSHGIDVQINPLLYAGSARESGAANLCISPEEYGQALIYLFDRWLHEERYSFSIEPFSWILGSFATGNPKTCSFTGRCANYLGIDPDGYILPCGRWSRDAFVYGNINYDSIDDALHSRDYEFFTQSRSKIVDSCGECRHFDICHGGCAFSGYMKRQDLSDPDYYCASYMMLFDHLKKTVREELRLN